MTDRDLTPDEARAEIEAFMGEGEWELYTPKMVRPDIEVRVMAYRNGLELRGVGPTYRAAVDALKAAWRDAVRPWCAEAFEEGEEHARIPKHSTRAERIARVLKEDSK